MMPCSSRLRCVRFLPALLCAVLVTVLGCGGSSTSGNLISVSGKVTVGGKPLTRGSVSFRPDKARGNNGTAEPYGEIGADGTYTLYTDKKPGAPLGKYVVLVVATEEVDPNNPSATPKSLINPKYGDPERPILQVDIVDNPKPAQYDLDLAK